MSELCGKFQNRASNTVGGVAEIRTLQKMTNVHIYVQNYLGTDKGKIYAPPHNVAGAYKRVSVTQVSTR